MDLLEVADSANYAAAVVVPIVDEVTVPATGKPLALGDAAKTGCGAAGGLPEMVLALAILVQRRRARRTAKGT